MLVQSGLAAHGTNPGVLEFPAAVFEDRLTRFDALRRGLIRSVLEYRDAGELEAAGLAAGSEEGNGRAPCWSPATPNPAGDDDEADIGGGEGTQ